eukprot:8408210-Pyramimonas_sp.AAC.1
MQSAKECCSARGWPGYFLMAAVLESGVASGGVAIPLRAGQDLGASPVPVSLSMQHRICALKIAIPGLPKFCLVSLCMQTSVGLNATNLELLEDIATLQEKAQLPVMFAGDWNMKARGLETSEFLIRAGMESVVPSKHTYIKKKSQTTIDFSVLSHVLVSIVTSTYVLSSYPASPHCPVTLHIWSDVNHAISVLCKCQKIPHVKPFGPSLENLPWDELEGQVSRLEEVRGVSVGSGTPSMACFEARQAALDVVYPSVAMELERTISRMTGTTLETVSQRARSARIVKAPSCSALQEPEVGLEVLLSTSALDG